MRVAIMALQASGPSPDRDIDAVLNWLKNPVAEQKAQGDIGITFSRIRRRAAGDEDVRRLTATSR